MKPRCRNSMGADSLEVDAAGRCAGVPRRRSNAAVCCSAGYLPRKREMLGWTGTTAAQRAAKLCCLDAFIRIMSDSKAA